MASNQSDGHAAEPRAVPGAVEGPYGEYESVSVPRGSESRATATARLASSPQMTPVPPSASNSQTQVPQLSQLNSSGSTPPVGPSSTAGHDAGISSIAAELDRLSGRGSPSRGFAPMRALSPSNDGIIHAPRPQRVGDSAEGLLDVRASSPSSTIPHEDADIVSRHLVRPSIEDIVGRGKGPASLPRNSPQLSHRPSIDPIQAPDLDEFSSLQLEGGDMHRQVYRWVEDSQLKTNQRSKSFTAIRPIPESDVLDIHNIKVPGGFRRNFLRRTAGDSKSTNYGTLNSQERGSQPRRRQPPTIATNNFIEFLTLYGHFAGEELEEDDDDSEDYFSSSGYPEDEDEDNEARALLTPRSPGGRKRPRRPRPGKGRSTPIDALLLLLKSFIGTGILFLPKAFLNGGIVFSTVVLVAVALLSYYCFILLVNTRLKIEGSYGDIGFALYGRLMRGLILTSIVLSQFGFVSAYFVFVSQNLQAFISAVSKCKAFIDIKWMVLMQLIIFLPLSLIRDISKLGFTALVADVFILLGLIYLYYFDISTIVKNHGLADVVPFNHSTWPGFIGTAIFSFEGIGLIIPVQESMKDPKKFPPVLAITMVIVTFVCTSIGALSYGAFGSVTKTVVILNLPQDSKFVNGVQFLYSLAILLSTPLQLFPAIRILETELFSHSGKHNPLVKWEKNIFRFFLVMVCAMIAWVGASDLDKFVSIVGSFACVPLVYIYPPLLHYRGNAQSRKQKIADIALSILGVVGMAYTTFLTASNWGKSPPNSGDGYCDS